MRGRKPRPLILDPYDVPILEILVTKRYLTQRSDACTAYAIRKRRDASGLGQRAVRRGGRPPDVSRKQTLKETSVRTIGHRSFLSGGPNEKG